MTDKTSRAVITLRGPAELKQRLEDWAGRAGVSVNAAGLILLAEALRKAEREAAR